MIMKESKDPLKQVLATIHRQGDKYEALNRLRELYDEKRDAILLPYQQKMFELKQRQGDEGLTVEVRNSLYDEIRPAISELQRWYGDLTKKIIEHYDTK